MTTKVDWTRLQLKQVTFPKHHIHINILFFSPLTCESNFLLLTVLVTDTNIFLGSRDLFWLNEFQLAIEGQPKDVSKARQQVDQVMSQLKALTVLLYLFTFFFFLEKITSSCLVFFNFFFYVVIVIRKDDSRVAADCKSRDGERKQATGANDSKAIWSRHHYDSTTQRLNKLRGGESERLLLSSFIIIIIVIITIILCVVFNLLLLCLFASSRRERIKNLNFLELGVGGLDLTLRDMLRRTFESRLISNRLREELDLAHVKGVLLHGPPGTGKTLIARKISNILGCNQPKIVNGPEVESKWVGEAEKNIRNLFEEAQQEFEEKGENSTLHVVIFDEIDAIAKKRGGAHAKSRDGALNQLLCCMDGINSLDNVVVFGLTNRKDCLDPALLRPGRLEVQLEIGLPDAQGREDILRIHTQKMRDHNRLDSNVNLRVLAEYTEGFSGADLAGMVRSAVSYALDNMKDEDDVIITQEMLQRGLAEIRYAKEHMPSSEDPESNYSGLLQA
ncbi:N-ethylmaleimide sensitive fusion protein [Reticulomyxa filosa]|uniref:Vesicle-fusing ATPase n=1 Tax=Reticulomyxa filosa TaxID=46433 RepID=X6NN71_RETFI|nr:N-ethylmaleimide sensitive fusion protein [Reticulomyxa filosa]|eukprot:ETO26842.1 N-ethylmaleimide sensitive fusion protein [Reticulomyxa filosa]